MPELRFTELMLPRYYRDGLQDAYLDEARPGPWTALVRQVFARLQRRSVQADAAALYELWTAEMKDWGNTLECTQRLSALVLLSQDMPEELRAWSGINLDNRQMVLQKLYPRLRRHRGVVDCWLDEVVFPVEAKCFPHKITSTAWDLCTKDHVTTGFSGTDDARLLLPLSIEQKSLPALASTNGIVIRNLLTKAGTS